MAKVKTGSKNVCKCDAYPFPHRPGAGKCKKGGDR